MLFQDFAVVHGLRALSVEQDNQNFNCQKAWPISRYRFQRVKLDFSRDLNKDDVCS